MLSSFAVGNELYQAYQAGQNPTVSMTIDAQVNDRFFPQVLAETQGGSPNRVVVAGAHLDSVAAGPGVNDDGSGTSAQLEIAKQIAAKKLVPNQKIRFMWFGGEEEGLIGSSLLRRAPVADRGEQDHGDARHRHDLVAELRPARV